MREWAEQEQILTLLQLTADAMGSELKPATLALIAHDLEPYALPTIATALARCRAEVGARFTQSVVMERVRGADGRPGPNEAWAMVLKARDEDETVVWCQEMEMGWWAAVEILRNGDRFGARLAFIDAYTRHVSEARISGKPAKWTVSPGRDPELRRLAVEQACAEGLLAQDQARMLAPPVEDRAGNLITDGKTASGACQLRKLLRKFKVIQHKARQQAQAERREKSLHDQAQREAEAARKAEMLERAQSHPLWNLPPVEANTAFIEHPVQEATP
jgi:hypothetical protein